MKKIKKQVPLYKQRTPVLSEEPEISGPMELRETIALPGVGLSISVRAAKAKLSALLELVAGGQKVTITSDGKPKAVLLPASQHKTKKVFEGTWGQIKDLPMQTEGPFAEEIIRADRDGRGW